MYYSFIMLKPDALKRELTETIMDYFFKEGITIERLGTKVVHENLLSRHYEEVIAKLGSDFQRKLMKYFDGQMVLPMIVKSENDTIIDDVRRIVGKTDPAQADTGTIRGDLGIDSYEKCNRENRSCENLIHASDSPEAVARELSIWFGESVAAKYAPL